MKKIIVVLILVTVLLLSITSVVSADPPPGVGPAIKYDDETMEIWWVTLDGGYYLGHYTALYPNSASGHITYKGKLELIEGPPLHDVIRYEFSAWGYDCRVQAVFSGKNMNYTEQCFPTN